MAPMLGQHIAKNANKASEIRSVLRVSAKHLTANFLQTQIVQ
jgi:hypothetical protein